jgi:UDP-N-acetylglucosamine 2-epimerase (non-hydrolysing)
MERFMRFAIILGTRPEIIKLSPIIRELEAQGASFFILHTGQHSSFAMFEVFFEALRLPMPHHSLDIGPCDQTVRSGRLLAGIGPILQAEKPDVVLVQGDTDSVLAGALAAAQQRIPVGHVEAGLRSDDRRMPEELNRILTDHMSTYLFAPTEIAVSNLEREGIGQKEYLTFDGSRRAAIHLVGNTIVDAVKQNVALTREDEVLGRLGLRPKEYVLLTSHRAENVDHREFLEPLTELVNHIVREHRTKVVWPIHPRSRAMLERFGIAPTAMLIEPQGYLEFLALELHAKLAVTDSGGVQEEACVMGVPCVTVRKTTDRPETIDVGANALGDTDLPSMRAAVDTMIGRDKGWTVPYGDAPSEAIVRILQSGAATGRDAADGAGERGLRSERNDTAARGHDDGEQRGTRAVPG